MRACLSRAPPWPTKQRRPPFTIERSRASVPAAVATAAGRVSRGAPGGFASRRPFSPHPERSGIQPAEAGIPGFSPQERKVMSDFTNNTGQMAITLDGCFVQPDFNDLIDFAAQDAPEHPGSLLNKSRNGSIILNDDTTRVVLRFRYASGALSLTQSGALEVLSSSRKAGGAVPLPSWAVRLVRHIEIAADTRAQALKKKEQAKNRAARRRKN